MDYVYFITVMAIDMGIQSDSWTAKFLIGYEMANFVFIGNVAKIFLPLFGKILFVVYLR